MVVPVRMRHDCVQRSGKKETFLLSKVPLGEVARAETL